MIRQKTDMMLKVIVQCANIDIVFIILFFVLYKLSIDLWVIVLPTLSNGI